MIILKATSYDKSLLKGACFLLIVAIFSLVQLFSDSSEGLQVEENNTARRLGDCGGDFGFLWLILYVMGVLYMFTALAIVCDDFFVPSLEVIAERLNLSNDIAGATLMAAGGSAPELFTSLVGTFSESEVGFGTIVGSAVFNVLFVIGVCAISSSKVLALTWWPLARDCVYYAFSLFVLALFMRPREGEGSEGRIYWHEAFLLLLMYVGYVTVMGFNQRLYRFVLISILKKSSAEADELMADAEEEKADTSLLKPNNFRAGLYSFLVGKGSIMETTSAAVVTQITGDVEETFNKIDTDGSGFVDINEVGNLLNEVTGAVTSQDEIQIFMDELDSDKDGQISLKEFTAWYLSSKARIEKDIDSTFDKFDSNKNGFLTAEEMKSALTQLNGEDLDAVEIAAATNEMIKGEAQSISKKDFKAFYMGSEMKKKRMSVVAEEAELASEGLDIRFPHNAPLAGKITFIVTFPLIISLKYTVPDVRVLEVWGKPGKERCYMAFVISIAWIGVYSFYMVRWATQIGAKLEIPAIVMGLTFLAAGTSVPDLLSSVIVARQGHGDMAVSSSIGSNIFDVLVGLPFPWLIYDVYKGASETDYSNAFVKLGSGGDMMISIFILIAMLGFVIGSISMSGWKLTKKMGYSYFLMYGIYVAQQLIRQKEWSAC